MNNISIDIMSMVEQQHSNYGWDTWTLNKVPYDEVHITKYAGQTTYYLWVNMDPAVVSFDTLEEGVEAMYAYALLKQLI